MNWGTIWLIVPWWGWLLLGIAAIAGIDLWIRARGGIPAPAIAGTAPLNPIPARGLD